MIHGLNTNLKINIVNYKMSAWKISYSLKYFLNGQKMTLKQPRGIPGSNLLPFSEKKKTFQFPNTWVGVLLFYNDRTFKDRTPPLLKDRTREFASMKG